jgi:hypothetical protein
MLNICIISCTKVVFKVWALMEDQYNYLFHTGEKYIDHLRTAQLILNNFVLFLVWFIVGLFFLYILLGLTFFKFFSLFPFHLLMSWVM